ncbi:MAG: ammonium transporter [Sphingobacteriia bacterium]|nr:ammonium transporter [Sphingobacteriia bacterium]
MFFPNLLSKVFITLLFIVTSNVSLADVTNKMTSINAGDTAYTIICTALVMLMTPGLALFYSGMVKNKNPIATLTHSFIKLSVVTVIWFICAYSIAFSEETVNGFFGSLKYSFFENVGMEVTSATTKIPHYVFAIYQGMFAVITSVIITGSFAERVRLIPIIIFAGIWTVLVYAPIAHWIWAGGWVHKALSPIDFAGGAVVHINAAVAGLIAAIVIGKKTNEALVYKTTNLPVTILGSGLVWFGWFGFNAGSALAANEIAGLALANTHIAAASGAIMWIIISKTFKKKVNLIGVVNGAVTGLVAITPGAGFVAVKYAMIIGIVASLLSYWGVNYLKPKLGYDDSLDVFGIHGLGGIWGTIATGIFCSKSVNSHGLNGLIHGNIDVVVNQILAIFIIAAYSAVMTFLILASLKVFMQIKMSSSEEGKGLDKLEHGEEGYTIY